MTNRLHEEAKNKLFGEGSKIKVESLKYLTTKKCFYVVVNLEPTDVEATAEAYPVGVEFLVDEAWRFLGVKGDLIITTSLKPVD